MSTTTPNKTQGGVLLAHTQQATAVVTVGSAIDVSGKFSGRYFIELGRSVATALTNEINFRIEASAKSSGNDEWFPVYQFTSGSGKTAAISTTLNGATTAGNTTATLTSGTSIVAGSFLYFRETGTPANSEWSRVASISGAVVTFEEAQTRSHTNAIAVTSLAEKVSGDIDFTNIGRIRLVVDSASLASGQTVDILAWLTTFDSATTV
jgi:hypothetical protein